MKEKEDVIAIGMLITAEQVYSLDIGVGYLVMEINFQRIDETVNIYFSCRN